MVAPARTGWYGKLPSLGDFASRRLAADPLEALDAWLALGLSQWRVRAADLWPAQITDAATWRFAWPAGTLPGTPALAGVLLPSVDCVGRRFPLALLHPLAQPLAPEGRRWLHRLEDLALDAVQETWSVDQLEAALERLDDEAPTAAPAPAPVSCACWWRADEEGELQWHRSEGLPVGTDFEALLAGDVGVPELAFSWREP